MPLPIYTTVNTEHSDYQNKTESWARIRDCLDGEEVIKDKGEKYLPRPSGMSGEFASAYDGYIERAHFPLIVPYALSGALGVIITKLPEFNVPSQLKYILTTATKDGKSLQQLFTDMIVEIFQTGKSPIMVDISPDKNEFRFVHYKAEDLINWKTAVVGSEKDLTLAVLTEAIPATEDIFSHEVDTIYRVLIKNEKNQYTTKLIKDGNVMENSEKVPSFMGRPSTKIPLFLAGSINNSFDSQPVPLLAVANCSIQIYRKEADLANSEYLSCNPTLCIVGASNDDELPNVVGSSVMIVLPNEAARIFYTETDTAALQHVSSHIEKLYEEAIRHGVAILDARKGVEAAEALRIRQATQSASIYSIYLSAMTAILMALKEICKWAGYNAEEVTVDAPNSLNQGLPDSGLLKEIINGYISQAVPLPSIHRYLVYSGLLDQKIGYEEYVKLLEDDKANKAEEVEKNLNLLKKKSNEEKDPNLEEEVTV